MPTGTYVVEIDWDNNGTFTGTGENVTARTLRVEFARGRDVDSQLTGRSVAGTMQILLNDQSGDYNSFNSASPLTGSLLPGRLVQLRMTGPGTATGTLWRGYIERITPRPSARDLDTVLIDCIGPLGFVNQKEISLGMLVTADSGSVIGSILDQAGWSTAAGYRDIDAGISDIRRVWFARRRALDAMREIEVTEAGFLRESGSGGIVFESRQRRLTGTYQTSQSSFSDAAGATLVYNRVEQEDPLPFVFSEFIATIFPYTVGASGTLWRLQQTGTLSPVLGPSSTITVWALYPNPTATNNAVGVDSWVTPTATTDYSVTSDQAGTGTNLNANVALTVTTYGNEMRMVFSNTGTRTGYLSTAQARGVPLLALDRYTVSASNTSTIFGTRTYPSPAQLLSDGIEGKDWADWNSAIYGTPGARFVMEFTANRTTAMLNEAAKREISHRISIVATGSGNLGAARESYIEAMKHVIDEHRTHSVIYYLSDGTQLSDAWVLSTSELGTRTRLNY